MNRAAKFVCALTFVVFLLPTGSAAVEFDIVVRGPNGALRNRYVELVPDDGRIPERRRTDNSGRVVFSVAPCKYVNIWVDHALAEDVEPHTLAGDFNHRTSVYFRARYGAGDPEPISIARVRHIKRLLEILSARDTIPGDFRIRLRSAPYRQEIERGTEPIAGDNEATLQEKRELRERALELFDELTDVNGR
jgi:hypothetical protein